MRIRALTIRACPWVTLIARGAKRIETRGWMPRSGTLAPGGLLAIHAGREVSTHERQLCDQEPFRTALRPNDNYLYPELPLGMVLCVCRAVEFRRAWEPSGEMTWRPAPWVTGLSEQERAFGDYSSTFSRCGWTLNVVHRLETPIPARGKQGLWWWDVPEDLAQILEAL